MKQKRTWNWFSKNLRGHRRDLALLCAGTVLSSLGGIGVALLVRRAMDSALGGAADFRLWAAALLALTGGLLALRLWNQWLAGRTRDRMVRALRARLLACLLSREYGALARYHSGDLVSRLGGDVRIVCENALSALPDLLGRISRLAGALGALFALSKALALFLLVAGLLLGLGAALLRGPLRKRSRHCRETDSAQRAEIQEDLENRLTVKGLRAEGEALRRSGGLLDRDLAARRRLRLLSLGANGALSAATQVGYCLALLWGVTTVTDGAMSFGTLTAVLQLLGQLRGPIVGLSGTLPHLSAAAASAERLMELEDLPGETAALMPAGTQFRALVFEHVSFTYPGGGGPALAGFSARLDLRDWLCLTGASGIGKSTVCLLALGLFRPQSGRVYVETDRGDFPCGPGTRQFFSYIPQDHILFSGSIRENLLLAAPKADDAALLAALEQAGAGFISELPRGLDTLLEERGGGLSEGQGQRIALARALLTGAPVLLLDECTSALDSATERDVLARLRRAGRTALAVTHRPEGMPAGVKQMVLEEWK